MKKVVATRDGYYNKRIVRRGDKLLVPDDLDATWFEEAPVESVKKDKKGKKKNLEPKQEKVNFQGHEVPDEDNLDEDNPDEDNPDGDTESEGTRGDDNVI